MNNERTKMRNALYRIQESAQQPAIQQFSQGNPENLTGRQVSNVSRSSLSNLLYHNNHPFLNPWLTGTSPRCLYPDRRAALCNRSARSYQTERRVFEAPLPARRPLDWSSSLIYLRSSYGTPFKRAKPRWCREPSNKQVLCACYWLRILLANYFCLLHSLRRYPRPICEREYLAPDRSGSHRVWAASTTWWSFLKWVEISRTIIHIYFSVTMSIEDVLELK